MPSPAWLLWFRIGAIAFGLLFLLGHVVLAIVGVRAAQTRDQRLEAFGVIVPGVAGLLLVVAAASPWRWLGMLSACAVLPTLVLGRAVYELLTFPRPS